MNEQSVIVVGGAGYIGSHMVLTLKKAGIKPIIIDNLSAGNNNIVDDTTMIQCDIQNKEILNQVFERYRPIAVMHFASYIQVNESVKYPAKYYRNNVVATINLLDAMILAKIKYLIFSSSAAIYGEPKYLPINESHPIAPMTPYGHSKAMVEKILADYSRAYSLYYISLRYFNAAGAHPSGFLKECHEPETHLIPLVLRAIYQDDFFLPVYGCDYPTRDGTCIRDFIHVLDICQGHLRALQFLYKHRQHGIYNFGSGCGYTIKEVIKTAEQVTGKEVKLIYRDRRVGDPAILVADPSLAERELNWQRQYSSLSTMIRHAEWSYVNKLYSKDNKSHKTFTDQS